MQFVKRLVSASRMSVNPSDPRTFPRPPLVEQASRHVRVQWPGTDADQAPSDAQLIAASDRAYWVLETHHPPTYYIPRNDVKILLREITGRSSYCEWKGMATYYEVMTPQDTAISARAWSYEDPSPRFACLKGCVSFYADSNWECFVNDEKVEPQPGDFYGGWMTNDIIRERVKGAPGTTHW